MLQIMRDVLPLVGSKAGLLPIGRGAALGFGARGETDAGLLGERTERGEGRFSTSVFRDLSLAPSTVSVMLRLFPGSSGGCGGGGMQYAVTGHNSGRQYTVT